MSDCLTALIAFLFLAALWITPIVLGVRTARRKSRSPHWMWFGLHPVGGWIAFIVLSALPPLRECPRCAEKSRAHAKVCPYCTTPFGEEAPAPGAPALPVNAPPAVAAPRVAPLAFSPGNPLLIGRLLVSALCFFMVFVYALVFNTAVLHGNLARFFHGFGQVPFWEPAVISLMIISGLTFILTLLGHRWFFHGSRPRPTAAGAVIATVIASALMETIAIYGLTLGFMFGPEVAPLTLVLMAVTVLGGVCVFPRGERWMQGPPTGV